MTGARFTRTGFFATVASPSPSTTAQLGASVSGANFMGLALGQANGQNLLYAADFHNGTIDVFDSSFQRVTLSGNFSDPSLPAGYAIRTFDPTRDAAAWLRLHNAVFADHFCFADLFESPRQPLPEP